MPHRPDTATPRGDGKFDRFLAELATDEAPRLFAVAVEYDDREDTCIAAYGLAFADRSEVVGVEGGFFATLERPENSLLFFTERGEATPHLVWLPNARERPQHPAATPTASTGGTAC